MNSLEKKEKKTILFPTPFSLQPSLVSWTWQEALISSVTSDWHAHLNSKASIHSKNRIVVLMQAWLYSATPLFQTLLGPTQSVLIRGVSTFQGLLMYVNNIIICKIRLGLHTVYALQWMSVFQGCLQGGVLLYHM